MIPAAELIRLPFFQGIPREAVEMLARDAAVRSFEPNTLIAHQHDRAAAVFFLLSGVVQFLIRVEGGSDLLVGVTREPGALIGWSVFRAPYRYTASARCEQDTRVVRIPRDAFSELFQRDARCGVVLLHRVASTMAVRVERTRDRLLEVHPGETEDARGTPPAATVAMTAGPRWELDQTIQFLHHSPFFEEIAPRHLGHLARVARAESFEKGQVLFTQNQPAFALFLLREGKVGLYYGGRDVGERVFMRSIAGAGEPLGWSALVEPRHYRVTGVALEATRTLAIPSDELEAYVEAEPGFGLALMHKVLWVIGNRLRSTRIRLVAKRYDKEALAVRALLDQSAESLHVTSPLHKIPYLLENRLTLADAFHTLELVQAHGDALERNLASLALEILEDVRRELRFYEGLQSVYETVAGAPVDLDPREVRRRCMEGFTRVFAETDHVIQGVENLPDRPGHIFIMNHLENHPENQLPNDFRLTLDTHFVSSMILYPKYGETPIRVVRKPKSQWYGAQQYFDRLDYIYVYAGAVDEEDRDHHITRADRIRMFLERAAHHLRAGRNVVIAPEGACAYTENSPQPFKIGAFRLAAHMRPEPLIVPVAVANFDKKITRTRTAAVVFPPFRLSAFVPDPVDDEALIVFANHYTERFRGYVREAIRLTAPQTDSERNGTKDQNNGRTSEGLGAGRA